MKPPAERGRSPEHIEALVADRDDAREAVKAADPKWVTA